MPRPDEGLIHAWLDGQLPPDEAARVERLAATDAEWAAAVAEARGLVAASSRILSALDHVPAGVVPASRARRATSRVPWWMKMAAAVVLVAGGSAVVLQRVPDEAKRPMPEPATATALEDRALPAPRPDPVPTPRMPKANPAPAPAPAPAPTLSASPRTTVEPAQPQANAMAAAGAAKAQESVMDRAVARVESSAAAAPSAQRLVGGIAAAPFAARRAALCFRVVPSDTTVPPVVMRSVRADGDTLRLETVPDASPLHASIVWRAGAGTGVMTRRGDARAVMSVVAQPLPCPAP